MDQDKDLDIKKRKSVGGIILEDDANDADENTAAGDNKAETEKPSFWKKLIKDKSDKADGTDEAGKAEAGKDDKEKEYLIKNPVLREIVSWISVLVFAAAIAFIVNTFIFANSVVPTGSMEDTIQQGDRVLGLRLAYTFGEPQRGDISIFEFGWICNRCGEAQGEGDAPDICPSCGQEITSPETLYYLKRLIGMPGDKIEIRQEGTVAQSEIESLMGPGGSTGDSGLRLATAAVYINGEKLEEDYLKEPMLYTGDMDFEVPENCYFFMGDNRNNSQDARYWNNPYINRDKILAKVILRYLPNPSLIK